MLAEECWLVQLKQRWGRLGQRMRHSCCLCFVINAFRVILVVKDSLRIRLETKIFCISASAKAEMFTFERK